MYSLIRVGYRTGNEHTAARNVCSRRERRNKSDRCTAVARLRRMCVYGNSGTTERLPCRSKNVKLCVLLHARQHHGYGHRHQIQGAVVGKVWACILVYTCSRTDKYIALAKKAMGFVADKIRHTARYWTHLAESDQYRLYNIFYTTTVILHKWLNRAAYVWAKLVFTLYGGPHGAFVCKLTALKVSYSSMYSQVKRGRLLGLTN